MEIGNPYSSKGNHKQGCQTLDDQFFLAGITIKTSFSPIKNKRITASAMYLKTTKLFPLVDKMGVTMNPMKMATPPNEGMES
jgi:hypothetical protein